MLSYYDYRAISINGHHSLEQRTKALEQFNAGTYDILVGTDVLARGMNIPNLSRVILYEMPPVNRYEQFVHRVGRVGRAGNFGKAYIFFDVDNPNDMRMAHYLREQLIKARQRVPDWLNEMADDQIGWEMRARRLNVEQGPMQKGGKN